MKTAIAVEKFENAEQLINLLTALAKQVALVNPNEILMEQPGVVVLIEEKLTDNSKVYNLEIH
jgi:hypothetical protein